MLFFVSAVLPVSADLALTINAKYNNVDDAISVSGTVESDMGMIPLTLTVTDPDGNFAAAAQTVAEKDKKGIVRYSFEPIKLSYLATSGDYKLDVSGHYVENIETTVVKITGIDAVLAVLTTIAETTTPYAIMLANAGTFGVNDKALNALSANGQSVFNSLINKQNYSLPDTVITEEDAHQVKKIQKEISDALPEFLKISEFADIKTHDELSKWLKENYSVFGFDKDSEVTEESEKTLTEYVKLVQNEPEFYQRIVAKENLLTKENIQKALYEAALLTTISKQSDYQIINAVKTFTSFFPIDTLSDAELATACEEIAGNYYNSYSEVVEALTGESDDSPSGSTSGGSSSGGSSSKNSGWGSVSGNLFVSQDIKTDKIPYSDLNGYDWAIEAIAEMTENGILTGRENGIFAPDATITRAEMIKILLLATGREPDANAEIGFSDVKPESWYAAYVATARKIGLAKGNEEGLFMPEEKVTRQDAAVLLYRAFAMQGVGEKLDFADSVKIAPYAESAVSMLVSRGIMRGMGENQFAPLAFTTRAQAALMVYRTQQIQ